MRDASTYPKDGVPDGRGGEWAPRAFGPRVRLRLDTSTDPTASVEAYVNHGRWVVGCPDCNGAQLACRTDRRFLCNECGNIAIRGLWRPVVWPVDIPGIEDALARRPEDNQNWEPGQTVADLTAETLVHRGDV